MVSYLLRMLCGRDIITATTTNPTANLVDFCLNVDITFVFPNVPLTNSLITSPFIC